MHNQCSQAQLVHVAKNMYTTSTNQVSATGALRAPLNRCTLSE